MADSQKNLLWIEYDGSNEKQPHRLRSAMKQHVMLDFLDKKAQSKSLTRRKSSQHDANRAKSALLQRLVCPEPTPALVCHEDQLVYRAAWWHNYSIPHPMAEKLNDVPDWQQQCKREWRAGLWEVARLDETFLEIFLMLAAAKEAAVKRLADAPAYYRHKGKALRLLAEDINDEGPALRIEAIAAIATICHMHFFESDYEGAECHCEALARLMANRLHQLPKILWQPITTADLHLAAMQMRAPRLPYHLHGDLRSLYFYNPSEKIVNMTLSSIESFPVGAVFSVDQSHRTKRLLQGLHGLAHAQSRFDLGRDDVWAHIYDCQYLQAQLQVEVHEHGSIEERIILVGCQMQLWGMMANIIAQPDMQRSQLSRLESIISSVEPTTLCDSWLELTRSLDLLLWTLCNAGICVLQLKGSRFIATGPLPSWLQPYLEHIFERLSIEQDKDLRTILQRMPFTERWNDRACQSFTVWSKRDIMTPSSSSSQDSPSPSPHTLFVRLRQDFDDWIEV